MTNEQIIYTVAIGSGALGLIAYSIWDFGALVVRGLTPADFIFPPVKCVVIGFLVALSCCATGLGRRGRGWWGGRQWGRG